MDGFNTTLLILHFLGLTMGMSVTFGNMVMQPLIAKAAPAEKAVLGRFPPALSRVGHIGLALLWVTGATMAYTKWNGIVSLPWTFHVKLTAVVLLTIVVGYLGVLERRIRQGDTAALGRLQRVAPLASLLAVVAIVFAVLTFD